MSNVPIIQTTTQDDIVTGYYLEILDNTTSILGEYDFRSFELRDPIPNPVYNQTKIQFISGKHETIEFVIYDMLGKQINSRIISAERGINTIDLNINYLDEGIYMYSINNGEDFLTKRMIVTE